MNIGQLREALAEFPDYHEVAIEGMDEDWDPEVSPIRQIRATTNHNGPRVLLSVFAPTPVQPPPMTKALLEQRRFERAEP